MFPPGPSHYSNFPRPDSSSTMNIRASIIQSQIAVSRLQDSWRNAVLTSLPRKEWSKRLEDIQAMQPPRTTIAVFGSTGAGKSSLLNSLLDMNIVPTSGIDACTSTVTQISYHDKPSIEADIEFLSEADWREELAKLLSDVQSDRNGVRDAKAVSGQAFIKLQSVYPSYTEADFRTLTVDDIFRCHNEDVHSVLGTTKHISSTSEQQFAEERAPYMQSRINLGIKANQQERVFWPLVRIIHIRCHSRVLESGAVLVDLPGVADSCSARGEIAKRFMMDCTCIWIATPITRAIDDKVARDLLMDESTLKELQNGRFGPNIRERVAFIATKCDTQLINCDELAQNLGLECDSDFIRIKGELAKIEDEMRLSTSKMSQRMHLPSPTPSFVTIPESPLTPQKRLRPLEDDMEVHSLAAKRIKIEALCADGDNHMGCEEDVKPAVFHQSAIVPRVSQNLRQDLQESESLLRKELNLFCLQKRKEYCVAKIQDNFRSELKRYDDYTAEEENPDDYDPDEELRDYSKIVLPVFLCSSWDYRNLKSSFQLTQSTISEFATDLHHSGIPDIQHHCISIAASRDLRYLRENLGRSLEFARSVRSCLENYDTIEEKDKKVMRERWENGVGVPDKVFGIRIRANGRQSRFSSGSFRGSESGIGSGDESKVVKKKNQLSLQEMTKKALSDAAAKCSQNTKERFDRPIRKFLKEDMQHVILEAVNLVEKMSQTVHQKTFIAIVRRSGMHGKYNLNEELARLMLNRISDAWDKTITQYDFKSWKKRLVNQVLVVLNAVVTSAPPSAKNSAKDQKEKLAHVVQMAVENAMEMVKTFVNERQKKLRREVTGMVGSLLKEAYVEAGAITGRGCVAKKKKTLQDFIKSKGADVFTTICNRLSSRLGDILSRAEVGVIARLEWLVRDVEVSMSTLWSEKRSQLVADAQVSAIACVEQVEKMLVGLEAECCQSMGQIQVVV